MLAVVVPSPLSNTCAVGVHCSVTATGEREDAAAGLGGLNPNDEPQATAAIAVTSANLPPGLRRGRRAGRDCPSKRTSADTCRISKSPPLRWMARVFTQRTPPARAGRDPSRHRVGVQVVRAA